MSLAAGPGKGGGTGHGDSSRQLPTELQLVLDKHVAYIQSLDARGDELEYHLTEHLRIAGIYWGLNALHLLGRADALPRDGLLDYVFDCMHDNGAFGAAPGHDPHILYTGYSVQILAMLDALPELEKRLPDSAARITAYIAALQLPDGRFAGDEWGETDTRFLFSAFYTLSLLGTMPRQRPGETPAIDVAAATAHVKACHNFDGGFGAAPGLESHAGQVYTCVGALSIAGELHAYLGDAGKDRLGAWLSERQLDDSGGLNGRPMKLVDVCYSWWVGSSLAMIDRLHWLDHARLAAFILSCQDPGHGGVADRPGDMVDVFHTHFAIAGLSLLGYDGVREVDAAYCMHKPIVDRVLRSRGPSRGLSSE